MHCLLNSSFRNLILWQGDSLSLQFIPSTTLIPVHFWTRAVTKKPLIILFMVAHSPHALTSSPANYIYLCHLSFHTIALLLLVTPASGSAHLSPCSPCLSLCSLTVAGDKHTTIPTALSRSKTSGGHFIMPSSPATSSRSLSCLHPHSLLHAFLLISVKIWENFTDS